VIGTYEYGWEELADSTKEDRLALGFAENDPLLRSGSMRASIATKADLAPGGAEGLVYSGQKKALWAELGTRTGEPPRSFLMKSLVLAGPIIAKTFGEFAEKIMKLR
jgi:hypothetical protein